MSKNSLISGVAAGALLSVVAISAASADTWRYAFEEAMDEVQGKYAQKFKEEIEANDSLVTDLVSDATGWLVYGFSFRIEKVRS